MNYTTLDCGRKEIACADRRTHQVDHRRKRMEKGGQELRLLQLWGSWLGSARSGMTIRFKRPGIPG